MGIFIKNRKGQSVLEYSLLIGIVISALLIMQVFIKRHFQGGLKESAEKMGEQFSASGTSTYSNRTLVLGSGESQEILEETTTDAKINPFLKGAVSQGTVAKGVLSYTSRTGGESQTIQQTNTSAAVNEKVLWDDHPTTTVTDYELK